MRWAFVVPKGYAGARVGPGLVERGGTVRGAWRYDTGEVPDFDELLAAARAM